MRGGLGGLLEGARRGSPGGHTGNHTHVGRGGGLVGGLGAFLNQRESYDRTGQGMGGRSRGREGMQTQQGAGTEEQGYTQEKSCADTYGGRRMNTQGDFGGDRGGRGGMEMGGGLGLGRGPLGLPIPTPQMAIKKLLKKVSRPASSDD